MGSAMCSSEMIWTSTHPPTRTAASTAVVVRSLLRRTAAATAMRSDSCSWRQWHREQHSFPKQCGSSLAYLVDAASANSSLCHCRLLVVGFAEASEGLRHLPRALFPSHPRRSRHRSCPRPAGLPTASGRKSGSNTGLEVTRALRRRPTPPHWCQIVSSKPSSPAFSCSVHHTLRTTSCTASSSCSCPCGPATPTRRSLPTGTPNSAGKRETKSWFLAHRRARR